VPALVTVANTGVPIAKLGREVIWTAKSPALVTLESVETRLLTVTDPAVRAGRDVILTEELSPKSGRDVIFTADVEAKSGKDVI